MIRGGDDERDRDERPRRSWAEIDKLRDGTARRDDARPSRYAEARQREAARQLLKRADSLFSKGRGGAEGSRLEKAVRDVHGGPDFEAACRAYVEGVGPPEDPSLAALLLDAQARESVLAALEGLARLAAAGELSLTAGLRAQLRMRAEDPDDDVAYAAEELLGD